MKKQAVLLLFVLILFSGNLFAETGLVQGLVTNERGAAVINAKILLVASDGTVAVEAVTGSNGRYSFNVPLGEYDLRIDGGGFGSITQRVRVVPGVFELPLSVSTMGATPRSLSSTINASAMVLSRRFLNSLSDQDSEFATWLAGSRLLGAGVIQSGGVMSGGGTNLQGGGGVGLGAAGGRPNGIGGFGGIGGGALGGGSTFVGAISGFPPGTSTSISFVGEPRLSGPRGSIAGEDFIVDGMPGRLPPKDQIGEVWIDTDPFTAEYSRPGYGRIHVNTRASAQALHGSTTFNFRDESLDSPNFNFFPIARRPFQSRYFHGEVSGPVIRENLSASLSVQRLGQDNGPTRIFATTRTGQPVDRTIDTGTADQIFNGRTQYQISERHQLNINAHYRTLVAPNVGVGGSSLPEQAQPSTSRGWDIAGREVARVGSNLLHEMRVQTRRDTFSSVPAQEGITVSIFGPAGSVSGGTSSKTFGSDTQYQLENLVAWSMPRLTVRMGGQAYRIDRRFRSQGPVLGQYTFFSTADYLAGRPFQYFQAIGSTNRNFSQTEFGSFVQADWSVSRHLSLSGGLRYEAQTNLKDYNNVDPRVAVAYQVEPSLTLRAGTGIFHQRFRVEDAQTLHEADGSSYPSAYRISSPTYPVTPTANDITYFRNSLAMRAPDLVAPYLIVSSLSLEKFIGRGFLVSATFDATRGMRQTRIRNINAPLPNLSGAPLTSEQLLQLQPLYPLNGYIYQYESVGFLKSKNLSLRLRTPEVHAWSVGLQFDGDYTLGFSEDDDGSLANNYNRRGEWGRTAQYPRHTFWGSALARAKWGIELSALASTNSGDPYSLYDTAFLGSGGRVGGEPKNNHDGPNDFNLDLRLSKRIPLPRVEATVFAYGQNVLNSRNYTVNSFATSLSPFFLTNPSTRRLEVGVRLRF
jgi:hypothetical protein